MLRSLWSPDGTDGDIVPSRLTSSSRHGSFLGGIGLPEPKGYNIMSTVGSWRMAATLKQLPPLTQLEGEGSGQANDRSPDAQPILGECPPGKFYNANGFSGHGFMVASSWVCS